MKSLLLGRWWLLLLAICLRSPSTEAATRAFDNDASDGDWFNATNWDPDGTPAPSDELIVNAGVPTAGSLVEVSNGGSVLLDGETAGAGLDQLYPGRSGGGAFTVRGGADLTTAGFAFLGWFDGSAGDMVLTGDGSTWIADALVGVGRAFNTSATTTGTLTISDGADFNGVGFEVGGRTLATGTLTIDAAAATTSSTVTVGAFGFGTANVLNGGTLETTTGGVTIGSGSIGEGQLDVDGGSVAAAGGMSIGNAGVGLLEIRNGGTVGVGPNTVFVGGAAGSSGRVVIHGEGSTFAAERSIQVGNRGLGGMEVTGGAAVTSGSTFFGVFGELADGTGRIDGEGSTWTTTGQTGIGFESVGLLEITNGGLFNGWQTLIGNEGTGDGELYVSDGGAYEGSDVLYAGSRGFGALTVETGGTVVNDGRGAIGVSVGSEGDATVTDPGSVWTVNNELLVGWSGVGYLNVLDGGVVNSDTGIIAQGIGSFGNAVVSGTGSRWKNANDLTVGSLGEGLLLVTDGGTATAVNGLIAPSTDATGSAFVGDLAPDDPSTATAVWDLSGALSVGGSLFGAMGPGDLTIGNDGEVWVAGDTLVWSTGTLNLEGGALQTGGLDVSTGAFNFTAGTLSADTVTGDVLNQRGTVAPSGSTTITGDYNQLTAATLQVELGGLTPGTEHDQLIIDGATLDLAGTLELAHLAGYEMSVGDTFDVVTFTGVLNGSFEAITTSSLAGLGFEVAVTYGTGTITVEVLSVTPPLPGDYNGDGTVDAGDYTVWRDSEGMPAGTVVNDVDGGVIGLAQYNTWVANFGATNPGGNSIPEPSGGAVLFTAALLLSRRRPWLTRS